MGLLIDREEFSEEDFSRFSERLAESVTALGYAIDRKGFGVGPTTMGAELELFLVDGRGQALPVNLEVLDRCRDPRLTVEISRYNMELNLTPQRLSGSPFTALARDMREALVCTKRSALPLVLGVYGRVRR